MSQTAELDFTIGYYSGNRETGEVAIIRRRGGDTQVSKVDTGEQSGLDVLRKPIFVGIADDNNVILLDPSTKQVTLSPSFPADAFPAHIYSEPGGDRDWFMNDGEKETGNDSLNCGDKGSSVTIIENTASAAATFIKTICVGRGHHQAVFLSPSAATPQLSKRVYISNLVDGTISVIGNEPNDAQTYLNVIDTINLVEPEKEESNTGAIPNHAYPHGIVYSPVANKLYCLNNGYGTIAIIDPVSHAIEGRIPFKGHSNLFASPNGRYLIGRGADRKSDTQHVLAKISVFDVVSNEVVQSLQLKDIYLSKYFYNPEGTKLYLTAASSGSPAQQANLKTDVLLVFDVTALPQLKLLGEQRVGAPVGTLEFLSSGVATQLVFASTGEEGTVSVMDGVSDQLIEKIRVSEGQSHSRLWLIR